MNDTQAVNIYRFYLRTGDGQNISQSTIMFKILKKKNVDLNALELL